MPSSAQALYFHLGLAADDDGFLNSPMSVLRMVGGCRDDLNLLFVKKFVIPFESGVCVIRHWKAHNTVRSDRYKATIHTAEKALLSCENGYVYDLLPSGGSDLVHQMDTIGIPLVSQVGAEVSKEVSKEDMLSPPPADAGDDKGASPKRKPSQYSPESQYYKAAKWIADDCKKSQASYRYPTEAALQQGADALRKLEQIDGVPWEQIRETLIFARKDDFWQAQTLSTTPFRGKYNQIRAAMERAGRTKRPQQQEPQNIPGLGLLLREIKSKRKRTKNEAMPPYVRKEKRNRKREAVQASLLREQ